MLQIVGTFKISVKSLISNRQRTMLTMIGIIIGVACVVLIMALGNGIKQKTLSQFKLNSSGKPTFKISFTSNNPQGRNVGFTAEDLQTIRESNLDIETIKISSQDTFSRYVNFGNGEKSSSIALVGPDDKLPKIISNDTLVKKELLSNQKFALLSEDTAKQNFGSIHGSINSSVMIGNNSFTVIGVFKSNPNLVGTYGSQILLSRAVYKSKIAGSSGNELIVSFKNPKNSSAKMNKIKKILKKRGSSKNSGQYLYIDQKEIEDSITSVVNAITIFIASVASISLLIAGISVMNMMYVTVTERTEEIAIRLAVGASRKDIKLQFLIESLIVTTTGGTIGFILGFLLSALVSLIIPFSATTTFTSFITAIFISIVIGVIFGSLPAAKAAKQNLIDIL